MSSFQKIQEISVVGITTPAIIAVWTFFPNVFRSYRYSNIEELILAFMHVDKSAQSKLKRKTGKRIH